MRISLGASTMEAIRTHARSTYPDECCGALIGFAGGGHASDRRVVAAVALENEAVHERRKRFLISAGQHLACERLAATLGLDVVGFYHSHPDHPPVPSFVDRALGWPWYCFLIARVDPDEVGPIRAWVLCDDPGEFSEVDCSIAEAVG
jgi:proteasome lid subunit RPN8/RPN11